MSKANSLTSLAARLAANMNFAKMGATVASTAAAKIDALTAGVGSIGGKMVTLAAQDELVLSALAATDLPTAQANWVQPSGLTGFYTQPAGTTVYYVLGAIAAGTFKIVQGTFDPVAVQNTTLDPMQMSASGGIASAGGGFYSLGKSVIPECPDGFLPTAVFKVVTAGSAFVPATTALTSISTFKDVSVLPVAETF